MKLFCVIGLVSFASVSLAMALGLWLEGIWAIPIAIATCCGLGIGALECSARK